MPARTAGALPGAHASAALAFAACTWLSKGYAGSLRRHPPHAAAHLDLRVYLCVKRREPCSEIRRDPEHLNAGVVAEASLCVVSGSCASPKGSWCCVPKAAHARERACRVNRSSDDVRLDSLRVFNERRG